MLTYSKLVGKIENREPFAFSRWGDGEWACILGRPGQNCDGHRYFNDLGTELASVLINTPRYYLGMQPKAMFDMGGDISQWLKEMGIFRTWENADVLHDASKNGNINDFLAALDKTNWHLVSSYNELEYAELPIEQRNANIPVPAINAWLLYPEVLQNITKRVSERAHEGDVFLFAAGMMSNVLIDDMYNSYGERYTLIDIGSLFDPFVGRCSRRYHKAVMERMQKCV